MMIRRVFIPYIGHCFRYRLAENESYLGGQTFYNRSYQPYSAAKFFTEIYQYPRLYVASVFEGNRIRRIERRRYSAIFQ